jgi:arylsulfatase A-like enzyme
VTSLLQICATVSGWSWTLLLSGWLCSTVAASDRPPNVVLFVVDDLGWRDLQCYGSAFHQTPRIDEFAAAGVRFTQAYASCHVCSPTRASLLTGRYPARLGLTDWLPGRKDFAFQKLRNVSTIPHLPLSEVTLAEALREHGYRTAHIGKWHLGEDPHGPLQQGFDVRVPAWNKGWPKVGFHAPFELKGLADKPGDYLTDRLTDEAEKFIEQQRGGPFFLYFSHFAVHDPIEGRGDLVEYYERRRAGLAGTSVAQGPAFILEGNPDDAAPLSRDALTAMLQQPEWQGHRVLPRRTVRIRQQQDNVQFAAMMGALDESFGRIVDCLRRSGLTQNTVVILCSDNGGMSAANFGRPARKIAADQLDAAYSTSNLPLRGGKGWMYEGGIRVPFIVSGPRVRGGGVCDVPVISNDVYPTVLELTGLPARPQQHVDGVSLAGLLRDGVVVPDRDALFWHFPHYSNHGMQSPAGAIRVGDDKLIEYFENGTVQLFDLQADPGEQRDLAALRRDRVAVLRERLHRWRSEVGAQMPGANPEYRETAEIR